MFLQTSAKDKHVFLEASDLVTKEAGINMIITQYVTRDSAKHYGKAGNNIKMDRRSFLNALAEELAKLGADETTISLQKNKMDAYLCAKKLEEVDISPQKMAEGIMEKLKSEAVAKGSACQTAPFSETDEKKLSVARPAPDATRRNAPAEIKKAEKAKATTPPQKRTVNSGATGPGSEARADRIDHRDRSNVEKAPNRSNNGSDAKTILLKILFCIAIPVAVILAAVVFAAFMVVVIALGCAAIAVIAALVAIVTVGCSVALIGVIYGAYKIVVGAVPVGLYEIGLGITLGGSVMLVGVLMYNAAIRLVPFIIRKLGQLIVFAVRKTCEGFALLKGAF